MFEWWKRKRDAVDADKLRCSFCQKDQSDVRKLIAGPTTYICDECVAVCVDIIADDERLRGPKDDPTPDSKPATASRTAETDRVRCRLCGHTPTGDVLPIEGRGVLCGACADAIEDALSKGTPREGGVGQCE
jgi:hypothetical protein